jgi:hypothetical protein
MFETTNQKSLVGIGVLILNLLALQKHCSSLESKIFPQI